MGRKNPDKSLGDMVRDLGFVFEIFQKLAIAVSNLGGTIEHFRRILREPEVVMAIARLLVGGEAKAATASGVPADQYQVFVGYEPLPPLAELKCLFDWVSSLWDGRAWERHPSLMDVEQVPDTLTFYLKNFGKAMQSEAVIAWADENGYRVATHLEALAFAEAQPDIQRRIWYVALGSFALGRSHRCVAYLHGDGQERHLDDHWFDNDWHAPTHFLLVRK